MLIKDEKLIRELIDVRTLLETETAKLAAQSITPDKADKLYEALTIMEESVARGGSGLTGDNAFHNTIADITGNDALRMILNMCGTLLAKSRAATLQLPGSQKVPLRIIAQSMRRSAPEIRKSRHCNDGTPAEGISQSGFCQHQINSWEKNL